MTVFTTNIINLYGDQDKAWLRYLPKNIHKLAKEWDLSELKAVRNLTYRYVLSDFQKDWPITLNLDLILKDLSKKQQF